MQNLNPARRRLLTQAWRHKGMQALAGLLLLLTMAVPSHAAEIRGYSLVRAVYNLQTGPETLVLDDDFGFNLLATVDTDFDLVKNAKFFFPDDTFEVMNNLGDNWTFSDNGGFKTPADFNAEYPPGRYAIEFQTATEGTFKCELDLSDRPLPPSPRIVNYADLAAVNPSKPLDLTWTFTEPPLASDFVEVYITLGHLVVASTDDFGGTNAFNGNDRTLTIPAGTLAPGLVYGLNLEITRVSATNSTCYPHALGVSGTLASTEIPLITIFLPEIRLLSAPTNGFVNLEVRTEVTRELVLETSSDLVKWTGLATNTPAQNTNVFKIPVTRAPTFFRARQ